MWSALLLAALAAPSHQALQTSHGTVHVYRPAGYEPATAGLVLFVHGYHVDVDQAWASHRLGQQFAGSRRNALSVVPDAPQFDFDDVRWPDLGALLDEVARRGQLELPRGKTVALAHSGGFRTVSSWLGAGRLDTIMLLDGLYAGDDAFLAWLPRRVDRRLVLVGKHTKDRVDAFVEAAGGALPLDAVPDPDEAAAVDHARLVAIDSQYGHEEMVTERQVIRALLALTALPSIEPQSAGTTTGAWR